MRSQEAQPGDWLQAPFWQGPVQVISIQERIGHEIVTVHTQGGIASRSYILTPEDWEQVTRLAQGNRNAATFTGDPSRFKLAVQAHLLRLAHSVDPYAALNASRIDPLPHQFEAVYEHLLARPVVRALLAHDAGAGKTIMAGMLIKELQRRQAVKHVLIVVPAGLTDQWRRELLTKFGEDFTTVSRAYMAQRHLDDLDVWRSTQLVITSLDFAKQKNMRRALESVEWDLVIVDEAHKMAAYVRPNGSTEKTQAYRLGEVLSRRSTNFLLMTATPHKGDPENYRLLVALIDPQWGYASSHSPSNNPLVLRRTKEEMRKPNGDPLYPDRVVETIHYNLSPREGALLEHAQAFIKGRYARALKGNKSSAAFALMTLGRRMASSPYALKESLQRIKAVTEARLQRNRVRTASDDADSHSDGSDIADWEDLPETERWERESRAEVEAAMLADTKQLQGELRELEGLITGADAIIRHADQEKVKELKKACDLWVRERHNQLIIFTEFKDTLDYLLSCLHEWGYSTTQIHGGMATEERRKAERTFWKGEAQILLATEAAGEGINLQCCHVMINFDIPWNPGRLEQRMGRIHRYGQQADKVYIFNLLARNSMEDEVKATLLEKLKLMRKDLGDKVFDVVGNVIWGRELRGILERLALGDSSAMTEASQYIEHAGEAVRQAIEAEEQVTGTTQPLDVLGFQQKAAAFPARRLSPEVAEHFFRHALPFVGGTFQVETTRINDSTERTVFYVTLHNEFAPGHRRKLVVSFWSDVCSDDELEANSVQFISPGHWLFEALLDSIMERCAPDLDSGATFRDLDPDGYAPYLVWFVRSQARNGLDQPITDMIASVRHQADREEVAFLPPSVLDGFELGVEQDTDAGSKQVMPMLAAQDEIVNQCVGMAFLPQLSKVRNQQSEALERDRLFLQRGLNAMVQHLSLAAVDAYIEGHNEAGEYLTNEGELAAQRLETLQDQLSRAQHLLLVAPEVLGVALVVPTPIRLSVEVPQGERSIRMRRDPEVEQAAMDYVMAYEAKQGRTPRDVHRGNSWDIESDDRRGVLMRYIEVKGRGPQDADEVWLTENEWAAAERLGERYWLYIVRLADKTLWLIQNPYAKLQPKEMKRWIVPIAQVHPHAQMLQIG